MQFEWDHRKDRANKAKHGVSFDLAKMVFDDSQMHSVLDDCDEEERWITVGLVKGVLILTVIHAWKGEEGEEIIRIISARKATRSEKHFYEHQHTKD